MLIASITSMDKPVQGFVTHVGNLRFAVLCQRDDQGHWEPICGIERGVGRIELPSCFRIDEDSAKALEDVYCAELAKP